MTAIRRNGRQNFKRCIVRQLPNLATVCVHHPQIKITEGHRAVNDAPIGRPLHRSNVVRVIASKGNLLRATPCPKPRHPESRQFFSLCRNQRAVISGQRYCGIIRQIIGDAPEFALRVRELPDLIVRGNLLRACQHQTGSIFEPGRLEVERSTLI